ncbi:hypothetical protein [Christiangramia echinicola]|uniref:Uncharacterized protein n=1 Tax=Christiangramia echinicola TaxID=279359 RepID=A0A1H1QVR4_9FLAO|nr:hypothetical protein [Christiangramia echinicola]SDS27457.1 hypothetical protein SAMN04488552_2654 [Christiangramia echinicola]
MRKIFPFCLLLLFIALGCDNQEENLDPDRSEDQLTFKNDKILKSKIEVNLKNDFQKGKKFSNTDLTDQVAQINQQLKTYGIQLEKMEYLSADGAGQTVFFNNRGNKQLSSQFVPNDPRNLVPGTDIYYIVDGTQLTTSSGFNILESTINVMNTWGNVTCSDELNLPLGGISDDDIGFVSNVFFGFGGSAGFFPGVIVHAGILPKAFFDALAPDGGTGIIGVTFTFTWTEDINEDGIGDVAIKEIYYNDYFNFQDLEVTDEGIDYETVSLHEVGHALNQAHFGKLSRTESNQKFHFSPRALMNAGYTGVNRVVEKTDNAGHCSIWDAWPAE